VKFSSYTNVALKAAKAGAEILLKHYNGVLDISYKGDIDPVTQTDKKSQIAIIKILKDIFPCYGILAEEDNVNELGREYCWIIDPLDGTVNFIHGISLFCVSVGLKYNDEIISGVIYAPVTQEIFIAEKNKGAWLNGKRIKVSKIQDTIRALTVTGFPYNINKNKTRVMKNFENVILKAQGVRRLGSAALDMAYVAAGRFDFFWEEGLKPWDVAAGSLIVEEAGGIVSDYNGAMSSIFNETLVASNGLIHKEVLKIINNDYNTTKI
jgi:myo-inositol-1(or 4)-monophosphatase